MYWLSTSSNGEFIFRVLDGDVVNPDYYLGLYDDWCDVSTWPVSSRESEAVKKTASQQADPLTKDGAINQAILCIRPIDGYDRKFIVEILRYNKENILRKYLQGGQGNLSAQIIQGLHFEFPCLVEQQKIAECLSLLDDVIEKKK